MHKSELTGTQSRRLCLFLLNLTIVAGITIGAVMTACSREDGFAENTWLNQYFAPIYSGNTVLDVFRNTFFSSAAFLAVIFILGFFSLGQPFGIALLVYRGVGIGVSVAQMYGLNGLSALPAVGILIIPKAIVLSFTASLAVRELIKLSNAQFSFLFRDKIAEEKMRREVKLYFIKFIVLIVVTMLTAMLDSAVNYIFMDLY